MMLVAFRTKQKGETDNDMDIDRGADYNRPVLFNRVLSYHDRSRNRTDHAPPRTSETAQILRDLWRTCGWHPGPNRNKIQ